MFSIGYWAVKDQCFWPLRFFNQDLYNYSFIPGAIAHQDAGMPMLWTTHYPFLPPVALLMLWCPFLHLTAQNSGKLAWGLPSLWGVPDMAILNSYIEVYWKHSSFIRCTVARELIWLPTHWDLQQIPSFASLVELHKDFLLCPHTTANRRFSWSTLWFTGTA